MGLLRLTVIAATVAVLPALTPVHGAEEAARVAGAPSATPPTGPQERPVDRSKSGWERCPIIRLPVADTAPRIDGDISDACWQTAYHDDGFWDPNVNRAPDQRTEIWLCVDAGRLYFAAYMHDTSPGAIRAEERKRNGSVGSDDNITVAIDPTYKLGGLFSFTVNPLGTMGEDIPGGSDAKVEWRGDWRAGAKRVADGWTAEAAIPWSVLRYPKGQSEIALAVARNIPRTGRSCVWPDMGEGSDNKELAHIIGLRLPALHEPLLVMPNVEVVGTKGGVKAHVGMDASHTFENGLTGLATVTPDFSNIEDEVESIDFSYTERYYSDRRPFFITGGGFMPESRLLYSRRIDQLDLGMKVFGKTGDTDVGLLQAFAFGHRSDTAAHVRQRMNDEWNVDGQFVMTSRDGSPHNQVWQTSADWGRTRGSESMYSSLSLSQSSTTGLPAGSLWDLDWSWSRGPGRWGYSGGYDQVDRWYMPLDGYVPETDFRGPHLSTSYSAQPAKGQLKSYGASLYWDRYEHFGGALFHSGESAGAWATRRKSGDGLYVGESWTQRPPNDDRTTSVEYWWGDGQLHKGGDASYAWGQLGGGGYKSYYASESIILKPDLYASVAYEHRISDFWDPTVADVDVDRYTLGLNYDISDERGIGFTVRSGTAGTNAFGTYHQTARKGRDWFLIIGDPNTDNWVGRVGVMTKWVWGR